jgi:hypothetical protein
MHDSRSASYPEAKKMLRFEEIGVLPEAGDNVAISSRRLEAGTVIDFAGTAVTLPHTVPRATGSWPARSRPARR